MKIPIHLKLKRKIHRDIAYAQDLVVEAVYLFFPQAVLHGGTAIWRCYNGDRFSEDLDFYFQKNKLKLEQLFEELKRRGFVIMKKRVKENSLFSVLKFGDAEVRLEAVFKKPAASVLREYETADGLFLTIYTFPPEKIIMEKVETFLKRRKVRDLYDIFFLLRYSDKTKIKSNLNKLIKEFKPPTDSETLPTLLFSGATPTTKKMFERIKKWVS